MRRLFQILWCLLLSFSGLLLLLRLRVARGPEMSPSLLPRGVQRHRPDRLCTPAHLALLLMPSSDSHRRQVIRETWGHLFNTRPLGLGLAFGVVDVSPAVDLEAEVFGDIFQIPLVAGGILALLQAAREACDRRAPYYLVKVEEDVFVNVFALAEMLEGLKRSPHRLRHRNALWCHVWEGAPVLTAHDSGWSLTRDFSEEIPHCSPSAYVMGVGTADALLLTERSNNNVSQMITGDAFVTGKLAREAGVELVQIAKRYSFFQQQTMNDRRILSGQTIFAHLGTTWEDSRVEGLWNRLLARNKENEGRGL